MSTQDGTYDFEARMRAVLDAARWDDGSYHEGQLVEGGATALREAFEAGAASVRSVPAGAGTQAGAGGVRTSAIRPPGKDIAKHAEALTAALRAISPAAQAGEWPPAPGDVWRDSLGREWTAAGYDHAITGWEVFTRADGPRSAWPRKCFTDGTLTFIRAAPVTPGELTPEEPCRCVKYEGHQAHVPGKCGRMVELEDFEAPCRCTGAAAVPVEPKEPTT